MKFSYRNLRPRNGWRRFEVASKVKGKGLVVTVWADDPLDLDTDDCFRLARSFAKSKGYLTTRGKAKGWMTYDQNHMGWREFYYTR